jgi:hypothetical protein
VVRYNFLVVKVPFESLMYFFSNIHLVLFACRSVDTHNCWALLACNRLAGQEVNCFLQHLSFGGTQSRMKVLLEGVGGSITSKQPNCMHL